MGGGGEMIRYSLGSYGADVLATTPGLVLPLLVVNILGAEANAYFYISWMIASLITAIPLAISTSLFVEGSHDESTFIPNAKKSIALSFLLILPIVLIVFLFGHNILSLFGSDYGENGTLLLWYLASSSIPSAFIMVYMIQRRVLKDIKSLTIISLSLLIIQVGLSYILMGYMGIQGIGLAVLVAHILIALPIVYKWFKLYLLRS
jgi:O-antigen/teichoic acid export membrane protein